MTEGRESGTEEVLRKPRFRSGITASASNEQGGWELEAQKSWNYREATENPHHRARVGRLSEKRGRMTTLGKRGKNECADPGGKGEDLYGYGRVTKRPT